MTDPEILSKKPSPDTIARYKRIKGWVIAAAIATLSTIATSVSTIVGIGGGAEAEPDAFLLVLSLLILFLKLLLLVLMLVSFVMIAILVSKLSLEERKGLGNYLMYSE